VAVLAVAALVEALGVGVAVVGVGVGVVGVGVGVGVVGVGVGVAVVGVGVGVAVVGVGVGVAVVGVGVGVAVVGVADGVAVAVAEAVALTACTGWQDSLIPDAVAADALLFSAATTPPEAAVSRALPAIKVTALRRPCAIRLSNSYSSTSM
jgi:hypothetical protein